MEIPPFPQDREFLLLAPPYVEVWYLSYYSTLVLFCVSLYFDGLVAIMQVATF